jgi:hypothetical protein
MRLQEAQHYRALLFPYASELLRNKSHDYSAIAPVILK